MSTGETRGVEPRLRLAEQWVEAARRCPTGSPRRDPRGASCAVAAAPGLGQDPPRRAGVDGRRRGRHHRALPGRRCRARPRRQPGIRCGHRPHGARLRGVRVTSATAESAYAETIRRFELEGYVADILGCTVTLADLQLTMGRLRDAERTYRHALDLAERQPAGPPRGTPDMHVGLCVLHSSAATWRAAKEQLRLSQELGEHLGLPKHPHRWRIAEAGVREAEGDLGGALAMLDEAERVYDLDFSPDVRPVAAMRARVWVKQGRPDQALALGSVARAVGDRRARLPARVRARHPGPGPAGRRGPFGRRVPATPPDVGRGRRPARQRLGDPRRSSPWRSSSVTAMRRWPPWPAPSSWPSPRGMCAPSPPRGRRWRRC